MSSTTGFDGKNYVKTFCITLSTSQSSDNNLQLEAEEACILQILTE